MDKKLLFSDLKHNEFNFAYMLDMGVKSSGNPHRLAKFVNLKLQKMNGP